MGSVLAIDRIRDEVSASVGSDSAEGRARLTAYLVEHGWTDQQRSLRRPDGSQGHYLPKALEVQRELEIAALNEQVKTGAGELLSERLLGSGDRRLVRLLLDDPQLDQATLARLLDIGLGADDLNRVAAHPQLDAESARRLVESRGGVRYLRTLVANDALSEAVRVELLCLRDEDDDPYYSDYACHLLAERAREPETIAWLVSLDDEQVAHGLAENPVVDEQTMLLLVADSYSAHLLAKNPGCPAWLRAALHEQEERRRRLRSNDRIDDRTILAVYPDGWLVDVYGGFGDRRRSLDWFHGEEWQARRDGARRVTLARWGYRQGISGVVDVEWPTPPADGFAGPFALARWLREALEPVVRRVADEADATDADGQLARRLRRRAFETAVAEQLEAIRREGGATLAAAVRGELPDDPERCIEALDKLGDLRLGELAAELAQRLLDGATPDEDEAVALFSLLCAEGDRFDSVFAALDAVNYRFDLRRSYRRELRTIGQDAAKAAKALRRKPSTKPSERTVQAEAEARGRNPWLWTASAESLDELRSLAEAERGQIEDRLNWASANWDELGEVRERLAARTDVRRLAAERLDGYLAAGWVSDAVAFVQQAASYGLAEGKRRTHDEEPGEEILARLADARVLLDRPLLDVAAGADTDTLALLALPRLAGDSADAWFALSATDDEDGSWRTHGNRDSEAALPVPVPDTADAVGALVRRLLVAPQRSGRIPRSYWDERRKERSGYVVTVTPEAMQAMLARIDGLLAGKRARSFQRVCLQRLEDGLRHAERARRRLPVVCDLRLKVGRERVDLRLVAPLGVPEGNADKALRTLAAERAPGWTDRLPLVGYEAPHGPRPVEVEFSERRRWPRDLEGEWKLSSWDELLGEAALCMHPRGVWEPNETGDALILSCSDCAEPRAACMPLHRSDRAVGDEQAYLERENAYRALFGQPPLGALAEETQLPSDPAAYPLRLPEVRYVSRYVHADAARAVGLDDPDEEHADSDRVDDSDED